MPSKYCHIEKRLVSSGATNEPLRVAIPEEEGGRITTTVIGEPKQPLSSGREDCWRPLRGERRWEDKTWY